ncbi:MAG TPA: membrane protein insertase YidC [Vicinamibacterales bacterium]|nr:membrane protein insertase YidC [Vicinamibacterales bacterium]
MEKRVFLAIFLCFIVVWVWQAYFVPKPPPTLPAAQTAPATGVAPGSPPAPGNPASVAPAAPAIPETPIAAPVVADAAARDILIETDSVHAVISTAGAVLKSWKLKKYRDDSGQPLELVPQDIPAGTYARPFTLATDNSGLTQTLSRALFKPSAEGLSLGSAPGTLSFQYQDASGLNARKTFYFQPDGKPYVVNVEAAIDVGGASQPVVLDWGPALGLGYPDGSQALPVRAIQFRNDSVERLAAESLLEQGKYEGQLRYAGVEEQYFLSAALPGTQTVTVQYLPITLPGNVEGKARTFIAYSVRVPSASQGAATLPFFMGPKDFDALKAVDIQLSRAIDFGIFAWLVVPLLQALKWINGFLGNFGWSIIVLTLLINLAMFPLRHKSMVSMRKMQSLQPEIKSIQDRYAKYKVTDPERQKMNQEMMALYKQKGVNPASGCVPMLLTMPVLFAFYQMLASAIELRDAPFMWWIQDLSKMDPWFVTPIIMGGTMFWQQKMMPTTADPVQAKLFMFMPVLFTVMFLWAPSGLVLYWLVSNIMAIGQQYLTNRIIGGPVRPPVKPVRAMAAADKGRK